MLTLRPLAPFLRNNTLLTYRFYARPPVKKSSSAEKTTMKRVHQETLRYVSPTSMVKVISDTFIKVRTADVHDHPGGDVFIAQLHGGPSKNCPASLHVNVSSDESTVEVVVKKLTDSPTDFHCELAIPIRASLEITTKSGATVSNIYGNILKLKATNYVGVSDIKAETIEVESINGNIVGHGLLLGKTTKVETKNNGVSF